MISQAERQYARLVTKIMSEGASTSPTKGECKSIFGYTIELPPHELPLLQGRKIFYKGLIGELKAFIANEKTVEGFKKHGCNFWGAWSNADGTLDVDYARLLHNFNSVNQIGSLLTNLKAKPDSRKHVISLWDPSSKAKQVPCVLSYQWQVEGDKLNMIWTQRSADVMIGLASDMFSAWLFNQLIAKTVGLKAGKVIMNLGDAHIYTKHFGQVSEYNEGLWNSNLMNTSFNIAGNLWGFKLDVYGYEPTNIIKFDLLT